MINDFTVTNNDSADHYEKYNVEKILCPVLMLISSTDPWISEDKARQTAQRMRDSKIIITKGGGHVMLGHGELLRAETALFFSGLE